MAYTTETRVKAWFRDLEIDAANTDVTTAALAEWIEEVEAEIDAKLSNYYVTPITGTESLKIVRKISTMKVAHIIKTVLEVTEQVSDNKQEVQTNLDKKADKMIEDLLPKWNKDADRFDEPVMPLPDATRINVSPVGGSVMASSTHDPTIEKGGNNW